MEIDLGAIAANWKHLAGMVAPGAQAAAVVKADGYGLGAAPVARALRRVGCTRFFVATLDEGLALRSALAEPEILILNGCFPGCEADFRNYRLIPVLNTVDQIRRWTDYARTLGRRLPACVHVDTGMARLGLSGVEAEHFAADGDSRDALDLIMIMSHLARADEPERSENNLQLDRMRRIAVLFPGIDVSLAASSGIFLGPGFQLDWVRPGAALYGVNPVPGRPNPLRQVVRLQARIIQVRDVDEGQSVGYGATFRAARRSRVAVVGAGYADGLFRSLSNRGFGSLGGMRVPLIGRVSMDLTIFDVTDCPEGSAQSGAMIELIGPGCNLEQIAAAANTNEYEILTSLGARYARTYLGNEAG